MRTPEYKVLPDTRNVMECNLCGSLVSNKKQHNIWHGILPGLPTPLDEIPFPENPEPKQPFVYDGREYRWGGFTGRTENGWVRVTYV